MRRSCSSCSASSPVASSRSPRISSPPPPRSRSRSRAAGRPGPFALRSASPTTVTLTRGHTPSTLQRSPLGTLAANGTRYTDAGLTTTAATATDFAATAEALTLYFVPGADFNGVTSFDFAAKDDSGASDATPATATVTVTAVPDAPASTTSLARMA